MQTTRATTLPTLLFGLLVTASLLWQQTHAHGRLYTPPARGTMWRKGFNTPRNYNDNEMFCGGFQRQVSNGYRCGICGDPYDGARHNEAGGPFATGTIAGTYVQGQEAVLQVQLTANHKGWFEFKICKTDNPRVAATQECLEENVLQLSDGSGTKLYVEDYGSTMVDIPVNLPQNLVCDFCVLQWRYHAGNSEGVENGVRCVGCGYQEEFYGCADIRIESHYGYPPPTRRTPPPTRRTPPTTRRTRPTTTTSTTTTTTTPTPPTTTTSTTTTAAPTTASTRTTARRTGGRGNAGNHGNHGGRGSAGWGYNNNNNNNNYGNIPMIYSCVALTNHPGMVTWCNNMCAEGSCNFQLCSCERIPDPRAISGRLSRGCYATTPFLNRPGMDGWCSANCALNNCPANRCFCIN